MSCDYQSHNVALKIAFMEAILDDLKSLSKKSYVMLLPDQSRFLNDPLHKKRWDLHLKTYQNLINERPWVTLIDLTVDGVKGAHHFRDGFHLKREFFPLQQTLFEKKLRELEIASSLNQSQNKKKETRKPIQPTQRQIKSGVKK